MRSLSSVEGSTFKGCTVHHFLCFVHVFCGELEFEQMFVQQMLVGLQSCIAFAFHSHHLSALRDSMTF